MAPLVSGLVVALSSWFPISPEGYSIMKLLGVITPAYLDYLVPAYLGVAFAPLFYFWRRLSLGSQRALTGTLNSDMRYLLYATVFTILIGYPLLTSLKDFTGSTFTDLINAIAGLLILLLALSLDRFRPVLRKTRERMGEEKDDATILDSIISGLLQGISVVNGFSRSGFVFLGLIATGLPSKRALELSFLIAPVYFIVKLAFVSGWVPALPVSLLFTAFLTAFVTSILTMEGLLRVVDALGDRTFIAVFGLIPVIVYLLEVIL